MNCDRSARMTENQEFFLKVLMTLIVTTDDDPKLQRQS